MQISLTTYCNTDTYSPQIRAGDKVHVTQLKHDKYAIEGCKGWFNPANFSNNPQFYTVVNGLRRWTIQGNYSALIGETVLCSFTDSSGRIDWCLGTIKESRKCTHLEPSRVWRIDRVLPKKL